jgi:glycosyltransferase involved in cell wall biosynthesis
MKVVINYMRPQSGNQPSEIFGIDVAITHFLKAFFRYSRQEKFFFIPGSDDSIAELRSIADSEQVDFARCAWMSPFSPRDMLEDADVFFRADPNMVDHIWKRLQLEYGGYAISSIVHTMTGERIAGVLGDFQLAPSRAGDSIVCPSTAIRDAVRKLWDIQADYYNRRFGGHFKCPVDLPVIPLGIHTERFLRISSAAHRAQQRQALGITEDEVVILYVGRMSYATKAHPLPLFQAAELAAQQTKKKVRLVLYGFFKPEVMEEDFRKMAADYCKTVKVDFVLNNDPRFSDGLWAVGDIFASLIDNIQESFGFTPIEAMACGLPAVISDWDGYRDGVRHGTDGFHVPTISIPEGYGHEVAKHYYNIRNYGDYLIRNNQAVAVDTEVAAAAFRMLIEDKDRRLAMGQQGRTRAIENYDWRVIIKTYEDMWEEQAAKRTGKATDGAPVNWPAVNPSYPDPSSMFMGFPSDRLSMRDRLELIAADEDVARVARHRMNLFGMDMLLPDAVISNVMGLINANPKARIVDIKAAMKITDDPRFMRSIAWLLKMGLVRRLKP